MEKYDSHSHGNDAQPPALQRTVASGLRPLAPAAERDLLGSSRQMRFDVYGRFQLEVLRESDAWVAYRVGLGTRARDATLVIPSSLTAEEIAVYVDDLFHELCGPGQAVRVIP